MSTTASVLIVDNTPANIQLLAEALKADYRVRVATQGTKALEIARSADPPDLILLDVMMPGMDGYQVCQQLKADQATSSIPVIFVTAKSSIEDEAFGLDVGAVDYINKPFHIPVVRARVKTHLSLKLKTDLLENLAQLDGLTNIPNRRRFDLLFEQEWARLGRDQQPLALAMIDVDHFKAYNDHYGHGAGDNCLRQVAAVLRRALHRPADLVARYGGEEFVLMLPNTDAQGGCTIAERARHAVAEAGLPHADSQTADHVTVSIGVAAAAAPIGDRALLLEAADQALYQAKRDGRNRCRQARCEGVPSTPVQTDGVEPELEP
ncbi:MAG: diguanylate cyclase [Gammaproteobacteria bacterium]|jgi:diguanylate cyclase (GGDEF)-like protein|nr:diguanylate cyclase [Gammaproteobacteria bacterium]